MKIEELVPVKVEIDDAMRLFLRQHIADFSSDNWNGNVSLSANGSHVVICANHVNGQSYNATVSLNDILSSCIDRIELELSKSDNA